MRGGSAPAGIGSLVCCMYSSPSMTLARDFERKGKCTGVLAAGGYTPVENGSIVTLAKPPATG